MEARSKTFTYHTSVRWTDRKQGVLTSQGKPDIQVATPPEFKGHEGIWSPEDLFVSAVNVCVMSTFLAFAERMGLAYTGYESEAEGTVQLVEGKLRFTSVLLKPRITLKEGEDAAKARQVLTKAEEHCLVSNSITPRVSIEPHIS